MKIKKIPTYFPYSSTICHHVDAGGCTFCGFHVNNKGLAKSYQSPAAQIEHFKEYLRENENEILKKKVLAVAPNGSWFTEVIPELRAHIDEYTTKNEVQLFYESRASLFNPEKAHKGFAITERFRKLPKGTADKMLEDLLTSFKEIRPGHVIMFGLEVANDEDLKRLNKGCRLTDYRTATDYLHNKGAEVGTNILLGAPRVENHERKAFETAKFTVEELNGVSMLVSPCGPASGTPAHKWYREARWNPINATAASEIHRQIRAEYPEAIVPYNDFHRICTKTNEIGKFKRGRYSEEEKLAERARVRSIADEVFGRN